MLLVGCIKYSSGVICLLSAELTLSGLDWDRFSLVRLQAGLSRRAIPIGSTAARGVGGQGDKVGANAAIAADPVAAAFSCCSHTWFNSRLTGTGI